MLSASATALLLRLHDAAVGKSKSKPITADDNAAHELRDAGLVVRPQDGRLLLTVAGVERARRMKGDEPIPLSDLFKTHRGTDAEV